MSGIRSIKSHFTKSYNKCKPYGGWAYANSVYDMDEWGESETEEMQKYFDKQEDLKELIMVHNVEELRAQRTDSTPEFFRLTGGTVGKKSSNVFVFVIWGEYCPKTLSEALTTLPRDATVVRLKRGEKNGR